MKKYQGKFYSEMKVFLANLEKYVIKTGVMTDSSGMLSTKLKLMTVFLFFGTITSFAQMDLTFGEGENAITFTPTTRIYVDGAAFIQDESDLSNGVTIPDVRLGFKVNYRQWSAKVDVGFGKGKISAKEIFLQYNLKKNSYIRVGHYPEPFSIDRMESSGNLKFMTMNTSSNIFSPNYKLGLEYVGWNNTIWFAGGIFGDGDSMANSKEGDDGYSATSRFVFTPSRKEGAIFHLGIAGSFKKADANGRSNADGVLEDHSRNIGYSSSLLSNVETIKPLSALVPNANYQVKYAIELMGALGPVYLQTEYFHSNVRRYDDAPTYQALGTYGQVGVLVTGGEYNYSSSWARMNKPGPKSLELVARFNYTCLDDKHSGINGGTMRDWSLAVNYYLNKFVMLRLNYSYMNMGNYNPVLAGENVHSIQGRVQVVF